MLDNSIGHFAPFQLVSLYDMIPFTAASLYLDLESLDHAHEHLFLDLEEHGHRCLAEDGHLDSVKKALDRLIPHCERLSLKRTSERILHIQVRMEHGFRQTTINWLWMQVVELKSAVISDLHEHLFLHIPLTHAEFYSQDDPWGIRGKFPSADIEIKFAGNCYATENYTACVFHLMRVVEIGAKEMVRAMKAQKYLFNTKLHGKPVLKPVELCDWRLLFNGLEKALNVLDENVGSSTRKKETFEFYNHAVYAFKNFRHAWRNKVSHSRKEYTERDANDIMGFTKSFMTHLAVRLGRRGVG